MRTAKIAVLALGGFVLALFSHQHVHGEDAVLMSFSSSHCSHCRSMGPVISELERSGVAIRHINIDNERTMAVRFGITRVPSYVVLKGGKELTRMVGAQSAQQLKSALAIDPSGPLIQTRATQRSIADSNGPREKFVDSTSESMPSVSLASAVERAKAATVRLRAYDAVGYGAGTGTIIDSKGEEALVITCGHLFRDSQGKGRVEVDLFVAGQIKTVEGQVIDYDADARDIALVAIRPGFQVTPVSMVVSDQKVRNGQAAFSFGCDRGADPSRRDTHITGVNKYDQHLGVSNVEISGAPIDGRSGGGLFDQNGNLIGVCNAADYQDNVGIYAGPGTIRWQLDRADLAALYQQQIPVASAPTNSSVQLAHATAPARQPVRQAISSMSDQEVIVIIRDRNQPNRKSQVITLDQPTDQLMNMIQQQSIRR